MMVNGSLKYVFTGACNLNTLKVQLSTYGSEFTDLTGDRHELPPSEHVKHGQGKGKGDKGMKMKKIRNYC